MSDQERESSAPLTWEELGLDEWANSEEPEENERRQKTAGRYNMTPLQVAKIELAVWKGTYRPIKYADPRALNKVLEVAGEVNNDEAVKGVIQDWTSVEFKEGIDVAQALSQLPILLEEQHLKAVEGATGALREFFPDAIIVNPGNMGKRIEEEFKQ